MENTFKISAFNNSKDNRLIESTILAGIPWNNRLDKNGPQKTYLFPYSLSNNFKLAN